MRESTRMIRSTASEHSIGPTVVFTRDSGQMGSSTERENTKAKKDQFDKEFGRMVLGFDG